MKHSTHAHPLPDEHDASHDNPSTIISSVAPGSALQDDSLNHQTRLLQLRNLGFRGPSLPFRRISPLFGASPNALETFGRPVNNENSPLNAEKRTQYGEDLPYRPVNILQEIHNSTRKKKASPRPSFCAIYEDDRQKEQVNDNASPISWYNEGSDNCTPITLSGSPTNMNQLREGSLNPRTPPPRSSPLARYAKGRTSNRPGIRSASSEASKYIEHLEAQLASAHARLESPSATRKRSAKLRALVVENRNLKHEVTDWEKEYDVRVQEEKDRRNEVEMELRQYVRQLEEEMDLKGAKIGELEWELESMRAKFRDTDELKAMNVRLEKRIEVLTNILVQSPMKLDASSATSSPQKADPPKRTPRPTSMLPRLPSSPGGLQLSLATVSESAFWQPKSIASPGSIAESPGGHAGIEDEQAFSIPVFDEAMGSPDASMKARQSGFFDHRSRTSISYRSAPSTFSRPSSIRSSSSFGPGAWGLLDPADTEPQSSSKRRRSMRCFPSGSNTLRPLILPTSTIGQSLPASAPIYPSIEATASRGTSGTSLDPTTSFFSRPIDSSPTFTPTQPSRHHSSAWVQEQTIRALEGRLTDARRRGSTPVPISTPSVAGEPFMEFGEIHSEKRKRRSRPRSLEDELKEAHANQMKTADAQANLTESPGLGLVPLDSDDGSGCTMIGAHPMTYKSTIQGVSLGQRRPGSNNAPKPNERGSSLPLTADSSPSSIPTSEQAHGIFHRLTTLITQTKQDPCILARRLLANAWGLGSEWWGGMGWWLLGLVYGTRWRTWGRSTDVDLAEDLQRYPPRHFDWQHFSVEATRSGTPHRYFRQPNGDTTAAAGNESLLAPPQTSTPSPPRKVPHLFPCPSCTEPSSRRTLRLWFQFSLAIVLALGLAIKNGPASLLTGNPSSRQLYFRHESPLSKAQRRKRGELEGGGEADWTSRDGSHDSGYGSIVFAEILGPGDFERP